jgi:DNA-binding beta-propeller fold protein YncE
VARCGRIELARRAAGTQIARMTNASSRFNASRIHLRIAAVCLTVGCQSTSGTAGARVSGGQPAGRPTGTLVVSNMRDNTAMLLDASTRTLLVTLPTGEGPHEVAVSHDGRWALVSNYGVRERPGNSITVINVAQRAVARTLDLGEVRRPHGMSFLPGDTLFAVTSEVSRAVLLIDFASGRVLRSLPSNGRATHMLSISGDGRRIVTGNIADATISVLELGADAPPRIVSVARQPEGIAITPDGAFAWVGSNQDSVVLVVDKRSGQSVDTLRNFGLPYRIAISADGNRAVISDPVKAQVRVFDARTRREQFAISIPRDSLVATAEVAGSPSPEGVAISGDGRWAFVTLQGRNRVVTIDLDRGAIVGYGLTGNWSDGIGYSRLTVGR